MMAMAIGISFGYTSNSGKFCMNSGFRNLWGFKDTSLFKAYMIAIAVQMLIIPVLSYFGFIEFSIPAFYPLGAMLGGFLFGMAMNWGGGCAAGVWYKLGNGNIGAFAAVVGLIAGYSTTQSGLLKSFRLLIQSVGKSGNIESLTLSSLTNLPLLLLSIPFSILLLYFILRSSMPLGKETNKTPEGGWHWRKTGLWVGIIGVLGWITSSFSDRLFGMAILPGSKETLDLLSRGDLKFAGWDMFFVIGVPVGAFLSSVRSGSFIWLNITGKSIWKLSAGGFVMGVSGSLAGGCTVGHGLTGIPLLSIGSITFTFFAIWGAWMGVIINNKLRRL